MDHEMNSALTFKKFLIEAAIKEPQYVNVSVEKAVELLNAKCKNALWMLQEDKPLYRGDQSVLFPASGFKVVDSNMSERRSQNTSNFYTIILDNHPDRKNFPKRSKSFVATTDKSYAYGYTSSKEPFIIIPEDSAKIGFVNRLDMWNTVIKLFGYSNPLDGHNVTFEHIFFSNGKFKVSPNSITIDDFYKFDKALKAGDEEAFKTLSKAIGRMNADMYRNSFIEEIWKAYSAESTGHTVHTTKNMPRDRDKISEVWVGGKMVFIQPEVWQDMRKAYRGK